MKKLLRYFGYVRADTMPVISAEGVAFGNSWFSHGHISGIDAPVGEPLVPETITQREYVKFVEGVLNAA